MSTLYLYEILRAPQVGVKMVLRRISSGSCRLKIILKRFSGFPMTLTDCNRVEKSS